MGNRLHPSVRARLFAEMRQIIESHPERDALLSRLNVLERDGVGNLSATQPNKEVV